jgi:hypothetical protein
MPNSSSGCRNGLYLTICVVCAAVGSNFGLATDFKGRCNWGRVSGFDSQLSFSQILAGFGHTCTRGQTRNPASLPTQLNLPSEPRGTQGRRGSRRWLAKLLATVGGQAPRGSCPSQLLQSTQISNRTQPVYGEGEEKRWQVVPQIEGATREEPKGEGASTRWSAKLLATVVGRTLLGRFSHPVLQPTPFPTHFR